MSKATRFAVAVHALALIHAFGDTKPLSSERMAESVGTNPSFVRRVLAMLAHAGLVRSSPGVPGAILARAPEAISLLEVYRAVGMADEHRLAIHGRPNPGCLVGRSIQGALESVTGAAEDAFAEELGRRTLHDVVQLIATKAA